MTMAQLISHCAGFGGMGPNSFRSQDGNLQDTMNDLAKQPLIFQPGKGWKYGPGVDIQGYIIEKLSGQGLDEFFEQRIFKPLGIVDTGFWVDTSKISRVVRIYRSVDGKLTPMGETNSFFFNTAKPKLLSGGGGLVSTILDYYRFSQRIINGGKLDGRRYLKAETVKPMHTNLLEPSVEVTVTPNTKGIGFGVDFAIVLDPVVSRTKQVAGIL
jgi:CubicO group peptidase (beta-lactamase class C family)